MIAHDGLFKDCLLALSTCTDNSDHVTDHAVLDVCRAALVSIQQGNLSIPYKD